MLCQTVGPTTGRVFRCRSVWLPIDNSGHIFWNLERHAPRMRVSENPGPHAVKTAAAVRRRAVLSRVDQTAIASKLDSNGVNPLAMRYGVTQVMILNLCQTKVTSR